MKRLRVLQILNFWRLIPAYMCIYMAPKEVKNIVIEELYRYEGKTDTKSFLHAGHQMNYHSHQHRDEVWTVIAGKGKTIVDGMEQNVKAGDVITMSAGCRHTVIAETELKLIEVQLGEAIDVHDKQKFELEY